MVTFCYESTQKQVWLQKDTALTLASATVAYFVTSGCRLGKFLPHSCGSLTTSTTFGSDFVIHCHIANQRLNIWVLSSPCQLQFFEYQANFHLAHLLPEKGHLGERLYRRETQWMKKNKWPARKRERLHYGFSNVSQQEFRLASYDPNNLKTEIFSKLMPKETIKHGYNKCIKVK